MMRLRLSLTGSAPGLPPHAESWECTPNGGTIGRSSANDWVLPDPAKFLSGLHAEVHWLGSGYGIVDRSLNGVFLNDGTDPIGQGRTARLQDGDRLRIGDFGILVEVLSDAADQAPWTVRLDAGPRIPLPPYCGYDAAESDPGPDLHEHVDCLGHPAEPLPSADSLPSTAGDADALPTRLLGETPTPGYSPATPPFPIGLISPIGGDARTELPPTPPPGLSPAEGATTAAPAPGFQEGLDAALNALLAAAGSPDLRLPGGATLETFQLIGTIFGIYAAGSVKLVNSISDIKNAHHLDQTTMRDTGNNPLRWIRPHQAVARLLLPRDPDYLEPAAAVDDLMNSVIAHQTGFIKGIQAAFQSFVCEDLAPETLKGRFDTQGRPGLLTSRGTWYWQCYAVHHRMLANEARNNFLLLLEKSFHEEYRRQANPMRAHARGQGPAGEHG